MKNFLVRFTSIVIFGATYISLFELSSNAFAQSCEEKKAHLVSSLVEYAQTKSSMKRDELLTEITTLQNPSSYSDGPCPFDNQLELLKNDLMLPVSESKLTKDVVQSVSEPVVPLSANDNNYPTTLSTSAPY